MSWKKIYEKKARGAFIRSRHKCDLKSDTNFGIWGIFYVTNTNNL